MENENLKDELEQNRDPVPYYFHEKVVDSLERLNKRFFFVIILLIVLLVASNGAWIWYESQFQDEVVTVTQENADGTNNYIGNDGDIINGATDRNSEETNP